MICDNCGKDGAKEQLITRSYGRKENLLVIQDVPVVACPHCGETYLQAKTLHAIERIKMHRNDLAVKRPVAVAEFA